MEKLNLVKYPTQEREERVKPDSRVGTRKLEKEIYDIVKEYIKDDINTFINSKDGCRCRFQGRRNYKYQKGGFINYKKVADKYICNLVTTNKVVDIEKFDINNFLRKYRDIPCSIEIWDTAGNINKPVVSTTIKSIMKFALDNIDAEEVCIYKIYESKELRSIELHVFVEVEEDELTQI